MQKTVTLEEHEWQQLVAILAQSTGYLAMQKLFQQLQPPGEASQVPVAGDGLDFDPPHRRQRQ